MYGNVFFKSLAKGRNKVAGIAGYLNKAVVSIKVVVVLPLTFTTSA
jgi:hypothetical protein